MVDKQVDKSKNNASMGASMDQLSALRTILMGEQIQSTDEHFLALENKLNALQRLIKETEDNFLNRLENVQANLSGNLEAKVTALEAALNAHATTSAKRADEDKKEIGKLLVEIGKKLMD